MKYLVSADVTFFESVPYFSPQIPITISEIVPPSPTVPVETQDPPATKPVRDFRYVYTHRLKVPASEPIPASPSPVDGPPQPSASPSDLDILIDLQKGSIDHFISNFVSYDHLNPTFHQFALTCLLSLYSGLI